MDTGRLEAFSDGVVAILITIMVLELKVPHGTDWDAVRPMLPNLLVYLLSFIYVGILWLIPDPRIERRIMAAARAEPASGRAGER